jgi:hypothetical protein
MITIVGDFLSKASFIGLWGSEQNGEVTLVEDRRQTKKNLMNQSDRVVHYLAPPSRNYL